VKEKSCIPCTHSERESSQNLQEGDERQREKWLFDGFRFSLTSNKLGRREKKMRGKYRVANELRVFVTTRLFARGRRTTKGKMVV
jgi:hypothetical protein